MIDRLGGRQVEVISLGAVEYYRESGPAGIDFERQTVRLTEEGGEIAQVVTRTVDPADPPGVNKPVLRYQYHNHLGSATLKLDGAGTLISYEEYHPFGTSAYRSGRSQAEVSLKRYRFTKKERDEETGLYYFGLRYYAPWLGRWISADPAGLVDGLNLYRYARNDPATLCDPDGCNPPTDIRWIVPTDVTTEAAFSTWATREGIQYSGTPRFNAQTQVWAVESWTRVQPGVGGPAQPPTPTLPPAAGQFGHVAPQSQQPPAQYGTPGVPATRLTENEHIIPGQQLPRPDPQPGDRPVRLHRNSLWQRRNCPRRAADGAEQDVRQPGWADRRRPTHRTRCRPREQTVVVSTTARTYSRRAGRTRSALPSATNSTVTEEAINRGILQQEGNLFNVHRGSVMNSLPRQSLGQRISEGGRNVFRRAAYDIGGNNRFGQAGTTLARGLIPGFVEAELAAVSAPYVVASLGITNAAVNTAAAAAAAAPTATTATVLGQRGRRLHRRRHRRVGRHGGERKPGGRRRGRHARRCRDRCRDRGRARLHPARTGHRRRRSHRRRRRRHRRFHRSVLVRRTE